MLVALGTLQIILKLVERCNLACDYCYFFFRGDTSWQHNPPTIAADTIDALIQSIRELATSRPVSAVEIIFHGGEPLMIRKSSLSDVCARLRSEIEPVVPLNFLLQTNATLIDDEWIEVFSRWKISVHVSLDGTPEYNDQHRIDAHGRGSSTQVEVGIAHLMRAAAAGAIARPSVLAVVNPAYDYHRIYAYFRELGFDTMSFLIPDEHHDSGVTEEFSAGIGTALCAIFDAYAAEDNPSRVSVRQISEALQPFQRMKATQNRGAPRTAPPAYMQVAVSSAGRLSISDEFTHTLWRRMLPKPHLSQTTLWDFLNSAPVQMLESARNEIPATCHDCRFAACCRGGALPNRYSEQTFFHKRSVYCTGLYHFYEHVVAYLLTHGYPANLLRAQLELHTQMPPQTYNTGSTHPVP